MGRIETEVEGIEPLDVAEVKVVGSLVAKIEIFDDEIAETLIDVENAAALVIAVEIFEDSRMDVVCDKVLFPV